MTLMTSTARTAWRLRAFPVGLLGALMVHCASATGVPSSFESVSAMRDRAADFVRDQLPPALRATARINVQGPPPALHFPRCADLRAQRFGGGSLFGAQTVELRCVAPQRWSLYVPVQVATSQTALVALHALGAGHVLQAGDLTAAGLERNDLPAGAIGVSTQAVGQVLQYGVAAGQVITRAMLRGPRLVHSGQSVSLIALGEGVRLMALGVAMQDGSQGQNVMVRNAQSGRVVHGVVDAQGEVVTSIDGPAQLAVSNP